jgi:hypothetical protein
MFLVADVADVSESAHGGSTLGGVNPEACTSLAVVRKGFAYLVDECLNPARTNFVGLRGLRMLEPGSVAV